MLHPSLYRMRREFRFLFWFLLMMLPGSAAGQFTQPPLAQDDAYRLAPGDIARFPVTFQRQIHRDDL